MASAFNLLTAGGAQFDRKRFNKDINLFVSPGSAFAWPVGYVLTNQTSGGRLKDNTKGKQRAADSTTLPSSLNLFHSAQPKQQQQDAHSVDGESDAESSTSSTSSTAETPLPPKQKITITGSDPLPRSLHANLPSLVNHDSHALSSSAGQPLLTALSNANIHSLWGVQCAVGGCLLAGKDTMCVAPTGSGKTLAYVLPTLVRLVDPAREMRGKAGGKGVRGLIVVPTHDLAVQIEGVVKAVTRGRAWRVMVLTKATQKAVCESSPGSNFGKDGEESASEAEDAQAGDNEETKSVLGIDILIATPERLHHLLSEDQLSLAS